MSLFPVFLVSGDAYACGYELGKQSKELIKRNLNRYFYMWQTYSDISRDDILEMVKNLPLVIKRYDVDILEEIRGIVDGSGCPLEEIIALNARYELSSLWSKAPKEVENSGCTAVAAMPEVTANQHMLIGQNWDFLSIFGGQFIVLQEYQEGKPEVIMQTEAGLVGGKGMNSSGIGVLMNFLKSDQDEASFDENKTPYYIIWRRILNSKRLSDAMEAVTATQRTASENFVIAQCNGEIIDIEVSPYDAYFLYPDNGILVHTNHFLQSTNNSNIRDLVKDKTTHTIVRYCRARRLLAQKRGSIEINTIKEVLSDHFNHPFSICRHIDPQTPEDRRMKTLSSVIMDLDERTLYLAEGNPCELEYRSIPLQKPDDSQTS